VNYKSGRLDGKAYLSYPDGSILLDYGYKSKKGDPDVPDYRDGDYIYYDISGRIISKGIFKREEPWVGTFMSSSKNFVGGVFAESTLTYMLVYDKGKLIKSYRMKSSFKYPVCRVVLEGVGDEKAKE
jgi:antitoxin component YwqK of YwqJK toxin-antitoxin module